MTGFTHNQLKNKIFDEVQKYFDKTMSWIDSFIPVDSEVVKGSKDRAENSETRVEGSSKRAGKIFNKNDGDDVTIDATPLSVKIPIASEVTTVSFGSLISWFQDCAADDDKENS
ncbi:hypothetical protein Tco_0673132 [Tanacetum coccineum]